MSMTEAKLLNSMQMAEFVANGFLRMDEIVPDEINARFLADLGHIDESHIPGIREYYREIMNASAIPRVRAGTPLSEAYAPGGAIASMLALPEVSGAVESLVGKSPTFDHHFRNGTIGPSGRNRCRNTRTRTPPSILAALSISRLCTFPMMLPRTWAARGLYRAAIFAW